MALEASELEYVRQSAGDNTAAAYEVSTVAIQAIYDSATQGDGDLDKTIYYVVRRRWGLAVNEVSSSSPNTQLSVSKNQKFEQLERLLNLWAGITGLPGTGDLRLGTISTGVLALDIDFTDDDLEAWSS